MTKAISTRSVSSAECLPGEVLVSGTVRDLARTSADVMFGDRRGETMPQGFEDALRLYEVRWSE